MSVDGKELVFFVIRLMFACVRNSMVQHYSIIEPSLQTSLIDALVINRYTVFHTYNKVRWRKRRLFCPLSVKSTPCYLSKSQR